MIAPYLPYLSSFFGIYSKIRHKSEIQYAGPSSRTPLVEAPELRDNIPPLKYYHEQNYVHILHSRLYDIFQWF